MKALTSYMNDHLAGAVAALEMLQHLIAAHKGRPLEIFFTDLRRDIKADVDVLHKLIGTTHTRESIVRKAAAWIAEKLATERAEFIQHFPCTKSLAEVEDDVLVEGIARQRHERVKQKVQTVLATPPYSLAALEGVFDRDPSNRDLHEAGVWGLRVQVLDNQNEGILRAKAGETGHIATYYPVGLSCFDLSVEAPISSLASHPDAVIGIPWKNLAAVFDDQRERES